MVKAQLFHRIPPTYDTANELIGYTHLITGLHTAAATLPVLSPLMDLTVGKAGHGCQGPGSPSTQTKETCQGMSCSSSAWSSPYPSISLMAHTTSPRLVLHRAALGWTLYNDRH